jgi:hypothetical protein
LKFSQWSKFSWNNHFQPISFYFYDTGRVKASTHQSVFMTQKLRFVYISEEFSLQNINFERKEGKSCLLKISLVIARKVIANGEADWRHSNSAQSKFAAHKRCSMSEMHECAASEMKVRKKKRSRVLEQTEWKMSLTEQEWTSPLHASLGERRWKNKNEIKNYFYEDHERDSALCFLCFAQPFKSHWIVMEVW